MELKMQPYSLPEALSFNYEELKAALMEKTKMYETIVYSEDQIRFAKEDRASLNRLKKALNDERIRQEKAYMQPFTTFKAQINEIIGIIDKPVQSIDKQVKDYEERKKAEKRDQIYAYWAESGAPEWLHTCKANWLNASYPMKTIRAEIDANIYQAEKDLAVIRALPSYAFEAEEYYKRTQSLADAVSEAHGLEEMAKRKAAYEAEIEKRMAEQAETVRESRTVEPEPSAEITVEPKREMPQREWVCFKAHVTIEEAMALRDFFHSRGIEFVAV